MSHPEASWHTHVAATRAQPGAESAAAPARQLAQAVRVVDVCGIHFPVLSAGCLLAIQGAARLAAVQSRRLEGAEEVAVLIYCLAEGERAFALTESGDLTTLLKEARLLLAPVPLHEIPDLTAWAQASIAKATGAPEKKSEG